MRKDSEQQELSERRGDQHERQPAALEHGSHDRGAPGGKELVPAERDQVDAALLRNPNDRLGRLADAKLKVDRPQP